MKKIKLKELNKLEAYLKEKGYHYDRIDEDGATFPSLYHVLPFDRHQIIVFDEEGNRRWDVICQRFSYGYEEGLLEVMYEDEEVEGHLTAADVIKKMKSGELYY